MRCSRFTALRSLAAVVLITMPSPAQDSAASREHVGRLGIVTRPLRIEDSTITMRIRHGGSIVVHMGVDSLGRLDSSRIEVGKSPDSALSELAIKIARNVMFDARTLRRNRKQVIDLPFLFLLQEDPTPAAPFPVLGLTNPGLAYALVHNRAGLPPVAEAIVVRPQRLSGPMPEYPEYLLRLNVQGTVVVDCVIDTLGHPEPSSLHVISSANSGFNLSAITTVQFSVFRVARTPWQPLRIHVKMPVTYTIRR
jgi:TonB family protein